MTVADREAIVNVLARLAKAQREKDEAELVALYDPNAMVFDLAPPLGKTFAAPPLLEWLGKWDAPVEETWAGEEVAVAGDLAVCNGYVRIRTMQGGDEAAWWSRRTITLRRSAIGWRITHDHTSVPFYMDGSDRPALDLEPPNADGPYDAIGER